MSKLERKTIHKCEMPEVEDRRTLHRWTCDGCGTRWLFKPWPARTYQREIACGFLGLGRKTVTEAIPDYGRWQIEGADQRAKWVEVGETA